MLINIRQINHTLIIHTAFQTLSFDKFQLMPQIEENSCRLCRARLGGRAEGRGLGFGLRPPRAAVVPGSH